MRRTHILRKLKEIRISSVFIFFDTETKIENKGEDQEKQFFRLGVASYYFKNKDGLKEEEYIFKSPEEFGELVFSKALYHQAKYHQNLFLVAHNLAFDIATSGILNFLMSKGFKLNNIFFQTGQVFLVMIRKSVKIIFMDSLNIFKHSIKELGRMLGLEKLDINFDTCSEEELISYCRRDVEILKRSILGLIDFITENGLGSFKFTLAGLSFSCFRYKFLKKNIYIHSKLDSCQLEYQAYYGGRTECFYLGEYKEPVWILDVNSMYPYIMKTELIPSRLRWHIKDKEISINQVEDLVKNKRCCIIGKVQVETDIPFFPYRQEGKLIFPVGKFDTYISTGSFNFALEYGLKMKFKELLVYRADKFFEEYINYFWSLRKKYQSEGNKIYSRLCKFFMNSLYGKFGQRQYETIFFDESKFAHNFTEFFHTDEQGNNYYCLRILGKIIAFRQREEPAFNSAPAIASHITDYGRVRLFRYMIKAGLENVLYVDTDSLFVSEKGYNNLKIFLGEELGELKVERYCQEGIKINGLKDYEIGGQRKIKGISFKAIRLDDRTFRQAEFPSIKSVITGGMSGYILIDNVEKHLERSYLKGELIGNQVFPIKLSINLDNY